MVRVCPSRYFQGLITHSIAHFVEGVRKSIKCGIKCETKCGNPWGWNILISVCLSGQFQGHLIAHFVGHFVESGRLILLSLEVGCVATPKGDCLTIRLSARSYVEMLIMWRWISKGL